MLRCCKFLLIALLPVSVALTSTGRARAQYTPAPPAKNIPVRILKFTPQLTQQAIAARPDTDLVEFSNGKQMPLGNIRRMLAQSQKLRAMEAGKTPAFAVKPATTGMRVLNGADLAHALQTKRDDETIQLPSGRTLTVGQIRHLQPYLESRLGYKLDAVPTLPNLNGPSIKLAKGLTTAQLGQILPSNLSDEMILESPQGKKVTVGQLRQFFNSGPGTIKLLPVRNATQLKPLTGGAR